METQAELDLMTPPKKNYDTVPAQPLVDYMETFNLSGAAFGRIIGHSGSTVTRWVKDDKLPKIVALWIEQDSRIRLLRDKADEVLAVAKGSLEKIEFLGSVCKQTGVEFRVLTDAE